jgi:hypothetical protein
MGFGSDALAGLVELGRGIVLFRDDTKTATVPKASSIATNPATQAKGRRVG